jgi:DNA ligase-1
MSASWIRKLNEDNGRLHKEDVLKQALEAAVLGSTNSCYFLRGLWFCYNPYVTYGVKQIPDSVGIADAENPWDDFISLLDDLSERRLTGQAARDAIQEMSERFDSEEWNLFLAPILRRDMRCGVSTTTINKILKKTDYEIPVFSCQLASNSEGRPEMKGIKRLEPKLDGVRVLMAVGFPDYGGINVVCYSRNGKIFENFQHIEAQIENYADHLRKGVGVKNGGFVLDGEVVGNSFQELMRQARRKEDVQNDDSVFHIFDVIPIEDFLRGHWNAQLSKRLAILEKVQPTIDKMPNVELLPHIQVDLDTEEGQTKLQTYAQAMVAAGYEGIMIKDLDAPYVCTRSKFWLKWKPTITVDLEVIGIEEGTGRNMGRLGALVCAGNDHGKDIVVNAGSGFTDKERKLLWEDRNVIFGRTVEIMADAITQNQDGTYSLRFPRFVRFRDDKA